MSSPAAALSKRRCGPPAQAACGWGSALACCHAVSLPPTGHWTEASLYIHMVCNCGIPGLSAPAGPLVGPKPGRTLASAWPRSCTRWPRRPSRPWRRSRRSTATWKSCGRRRSGRARRGSQQQWQTSATQVSGPARGGWLEHPSIAGGGLRSSQNRPPPSRPAGGCSQGTTYQGSHPCIHSAPPGRAKFLSSGPTPCPQPYRRRHLRDRQLL